MLKCGTVFRCLLLIYALFTFLYNVFSIYLPYAQQGYSLSYNFENLSTNSNLSLLFHKPGVNYKIQCQNASIYSTQVEIIAVQMVIFINGTDDQNRPHPNIVPRITVAFFWSGQLIMLLVSLLDFFMPCDGSKKITTRKINAYEFGRINGASIEETTPEEPSLSEKSCRFFRSFSYGIA